ncbi:hypothetical protein HYDPIDRAFT_114935 [Hydnomerulius pinastri MD-312]|uniref:Unplaced genomic scaffold scaffold_23, whole genome shotgun sequence n=1 Tax=Hydnomerulius pinastri MD-312 TaxID=994086 RepID=A0A0C9V8R3_9AGAM|nr:hypothetical protein HYDPIDRAFT_114935 [Hydnomerulius pinastri MD-312]
MDIFINQLRYSSCALLAAYALTIFMEYEKTHQYIARGSLAPKHIVDMLRLNYFDEAIGQNEGFRIFSDLMEYDDLRWAVWEYDVTQVLAKKLETGKAREIRTSLICPDIFHSIGAHSNGLYHLYHLVTKVVSDPDGPWAEELVEKGLELLRRGHWKTQRAGVTILSSLAQGNDRVKGILKNHISRIIRLLLQPAEQESILPVQWSPTAVVSPENPSQLGMTSPRPSSMLGPVCALHALSSHQTLRDEIRNSEDYWRLRDQWLSGTLVDFTETPFWQVYTPTQDDLKNMMEKMLFSVESEEGISVDDSTSGGDSILPHIQHWGRLAVAVYQFVLDWLSSLFTLAGLAPFTAAAVVVLSPIFIFAALVHLVTLCL